MSVPDVAREASLRSEFIRDADALIDEIVRRQFAAFPELHQQYGAQGRSKCREDARFHLLYLSESVAAGSPALFRNYTAWLKTLLCGLGVPAGDIVRQFELMAELLATRDSEPEAALAAEYLRIMMAELPSMPDQPEAFICGEDAKATLAAELLGALLACQRQRAIQLVETALTSGLTVEDLYLDVFQPLLREVGRLWQINKLSVAQEHYCTAAVQLLMGRVSAGIFDTKRCGYTVVAACVGDELHEIGVRMVTDFFEMHGWDSHFLGANVPSRDLLSLLIAVDADVLCLSATLTSHLPVARNIIQQIRSDRALAKIKILVGGYPFNVQAELWQRVDADAYAPDARSAVSISRDLMELSA